MNVTEAARVWVATKIKLAKLGPEVKQAEVAAGILKEHFRRTGKTSYRRS